MSSSTNELSVKAIRDSFLDPTVGGPVYRVVLNAGAEGMALPECVRHLRADGARFAHARAGGDDRVARSALLECGFEPIEELVVHERPVQGWETIAVPAASAAMVAPASDADLAPCMAVAKTGFTFDRFHRDDRVPAAAADELKARWVKGSFEGRADRILVAKRGGVAVGFILCLRSDDAVVIDLIAVDVSMRGQGVGRALIRAALEEYAHRVPVLRAGTQASNAASLRMYSALGFSRVRIDHTFHLWMGDDLAG